MNQHDKRADNLTARILRQIDAMWHEQEYEMMPIETMYKRLVGRENLSLRERHDLQQAGIWQFCPDRCAASYSQALDRLRYYLRRFRDKKERPYVCVNLGRNMWRWVHVRGMCYVATLHPDQREQIIAQLEQVSAILLKQGQGAIANSIGIARYVRDLKAGKAFEQPELLGAA